LPVSRRTQIKFELLQVTDWYFVLQGALTIETRAPAAHQLLRMGDTYSIPPKTAHLVANRSDSDTRFLLVQGVGTYDFLRVAGSANG